MIENSSPRLIAQSRGQIETEIVGLGPRAADDVSPGQVGSAHPSALASRLVTALRDCEPSLLELRLSLLARRKPPPLRISHQTAYTISLLPILGLSLLLAIWATNYFLLFFHTEDKRVYPSIRYRFRGDRPYPLAPSYMQQSYPVSFIFDVRQRADFGNQGRLRRKDIIM